MRDCEQKIAQYLSDGYSQLASTFGKYTTPKQWNDLPESEQKHMIALVEKLLSEGVISPGRFFRYTRVDNNQYP